jgi:hypothetical protein
MKKAERMGVDVSLTLAVAEDVSNQRGGYKIASKVLNRRQAPHCVTVKGMTKPPKGDL